MHKIALVAVIATHGVKTAAYEVGAHVVYPVGHYLVNIGHEDSRTFKVTINSPIVTKQQVVDALKREDFDAR